MAAEPQVSRYARCVPTAGVERLEVKEGIESLYIKVIKNRTR